jgi:hypothetical protein
MSGTFLLLSVKRLVGQFLGLALKTLAVVALAVSVAGTAHADPDSTPGPAYQIPTPNGPAFPGVQTYPSRCLVAPLACGFRYHADTGTWQP